MLGNVAPLWEIILATMRLGAVIIPASTLLQPADLVDRVSRGQVRHVITDAAGVPKFSAVPGDWTRIVVGGDAEGWHSYAAAFSSSASLVPEGVTRASDPLLLYFTSGTTALPKLVAHTQVSYPVGDLSTKNWVGIQPGDVHLNLSSPGWAKHAWSNLYAPWNAGATVLVLNYQRFSASSLLAALGSCQVTTFCAPPTVWRMLIQAELGAAGVSSLRECVAAGEPLNPEVIEQVRKAWGITVRDGFGQTETTAQVGNTPGQPVRAGSMGRPLPGYSVVLVDPVSGEPGRDGEICLDLSRRPLELESVLIEHEAVAEAAVVPSPDPVRLSVPKAYVLLAAGRVASPELAQSIMAFCRERVAPYKRIRRVEFGDLPKTISGKIRRVELRGLETSRPSSARGVTEFWEEDFTW